MFPARSLWTRSALARMPPTWTPCTEWWLFFFQAEDGIRDYKVTGVQTCALPICRFEIHAALRLERDAIDLFGDAAAHVALAHVVRHLLRIALLGPPEPAAATGAKGEDRKSVV